MKNAAIARVFYDIADLLELKGGEPLLAMTVCNVIGDGTSQKLILLSFQRRLESRIEAKFFDLDSRPGRE